MISRYWMTLRPSETSYWHFWNHIELSWQESSEPHNLIVCDGIVTYIYLSPTYQAFIWSVIIPCTQITQNSSDNSLQKKQWLKFVSFEVLVFYTIRAQWRRQLKSRLVWRGCFQFLTDWKAKLRTSIKSDNIPHRPKKTTSHEFCVKSSRTKRWRKTKKSKGPRDH